MLTKDDQRAKKGGADDADVSSPFQLLFQKRQRAVSHPLTRSSSATVLEALHATTPSGGAIPACTFDRSAYDLRDTGLPGFMSVKFADLRHNNTKKTSPSEGRESTQPAHCASEPENDSPHP